MTTNKIMSKYIENEIKRNVSHYDWLIALTSLKILKTCKLGLIIQFTE